MTVPIIASIREKIKHISRKYAIIRAKFFSRRIPHGS
jgi:hypothetical protein